MVSDVSQSPKALTKANVVSFVAAEVEQLLVRLDPDLKRPAITSAARLAGIAAASYISLSLKRRAALTASLDDAGSRIDDLIQQLAAVAREEALEQARDPAIDGAPRNPVAKVLPAQLDAISLHDWVGPSAGPTFLEENFGIPRSTLHRWQRRNEAIALLAGGRRHVFPLAQFVDGRPANGIAAISNLIGHPRLTWYWLSKPCDALGGYLPIDLLKMDRIDDVVAAARTYVQTLPLQTIDHGKV